MRNDYAKGFNSITQDNKHVLLWDYDDRDLRQTTESLIAIQKQFNLSNIFIIKSRNGYNAICLDKFFKNKVFWIKSLTTLSDKQHDISGYKHDGWTLRIGEDKILESTILSPQSSLPKSNAHRKLLEILFGIKLIKTSAFDNYETILFEDIYRLEVEHD